MSPTVPEEESLAMGAHMCPALQVGEAALAVCQSTALHTTPPLLADTLPLGFKGLGPWIVHKSLIDPERSDTSESASDLICEPCPFNSVLPYLKLEKTEVFVSWDSILKASPLSGHMSASHRAPRSGNVLSSYKILLLISSGVTKVAEDSSPSWARGTFALLSRNDISPFSSSS